MRPHMVTMGHPTASPAMPKHCHSRDLSPVAPSASRRRRPNRKSLRARKIGSKLSCVSSDLQFPKYGYFDQIHQESKKYRCRKYRNNDISGERLHGEAANSERRDDQEIADRRNNNPSARK